MDALTIVIILALVGAAIWLVALPLWARKQNALPLEQNAELPGQSLAELEAKYQAALNGIHDLNFDYEMGKVTAEDFELLLNKTKLEAAQRRQQIDQLDPAQSAEEEARLAAEIETRVAELRLKPAQDALLVQTVEVEIEQLKTRPLDNPDEPTCPRCNSSCHPGDAFCARCGAPLTETTAPRWQEVQA